MATMTARKSGDSAGATAGAGRGKSDSPLIAV